MPQVRVLLIKWTQLIFSYSLGSSPQVRGVNSDAHLSLCYRGRVSSTPPPSCAPSFSLSVFLHTSMCRCPSHLLRLEYSFPLHDWMTSCWHSCWQYSISKPLTLLHLSQPLLPFYLTGFLNCKISFEMGFYCHPALCYAACSSPQAPVGFWVVLHLVFISSSCDTDSMLALSFLKWGLHF